MFDDDLAYFLTLYLPIKFYLLNISHIVTIIIVAKI